VTPGPPPVFGLITDLEAEVVRGMEDHVLQPTCVAALDQIARRGDMATTAVSNHSSPTGSDTPAVNNEDGLTKTVPEIFVPPSIISIGAIKYGIHDFRHDFGWLRLINDQYP